MKIYPEIYLNYTQNVYFAFWYQSVQARGVCGVQFQASRKRRELIRQGARGFGIC